MVIQGSSAKELVCVGWDKFLGKKEPPQQRGLVDEM
tara:strand:- start:143 stop:250 length:108 start_codon:yes stop_codon:yes gene_type:complete